MRTLVARTEFAAAVNQLANERGVEPDVIIETIKPAILAAYRKDVKESGEDIDDLNWEYQVKLDPDTGAATIWGWPIEDESQKQDVTPPGFGRIAAQTAKQVILQKIREAEKNATISQFADKTGTLVNGMILRFDGPMIVVAIGKAEAILPPHEQVSSDKYRLNQHLTFYIEGIRESMRGQEIIVSRAHKALVELLFAREVPEVASGAVEIKAIAREPGSRTKVAVYSSQSGVDPVGSCVGQKGVRVQAVIDELSGEKLDIIQYDEDPVKFITAAIAPAEAVSVKVNDSNQSAVVTVPDDQLSLAIGKEGQNVRLAAKLSNYKLDIMGVSGQKPTSSHHRTDDSAETEEDTTVTSDGVNSAETADMQDSDLDQVLSARTVKSLSAAGITSLDQLKATPEETLNNIKGLGDKALTEIKAAIS